MIEALLGVYFCLFVIFGLDRFNSNEMEPTNKNTFNQIELGENTQLPLRLFLVLFLEKSRYFAMSYYEKRSY